MQTFGTRIEYKGYTLKSRVEFAWAQKFEGDGFDWTYEPFRFYAGKESYKPDFGLDANTIAVETKIYGARNVHNYFELCPLPLILIYGTPERHYCRYKEVGVASFRVGHMPFALAYDLARKVRR